ncbi:MAG: EAL domain-containing protein, partial [Thiobacillus sp.]|nr:EAL domain-containing protein [Thiobacillus sp.]
LKIDKSFVMEMETNDNDAVIVRSTIDLAHNLGLKVTAEGVETQDAWDTLSVLGCDQSQGYFMGRPMSVGNLYAWLHNSARTDISTPVL